MLISDFIEQLNHSPEKVDFQSVMQLIESQYHYSPTAFRNGEITNEMGTNEGSCKIFAFARLNQLNEQQTLACFGSFYRDDVVKNPQGQDHGNIRNFIKTGWSGIEFSQPALKEKTL